MKIPSFNTVLSGVRTARTATSNYVSSGMLGASTGSISSTLADKASKLKNSKFGKWAQNLVDGINKKLHINELKEFAGKKLESIKEGFSKLTEKGFGKKVADAFKSVKENKVVKNVTTWVSEKYNAIKESRPVKFVSNAVKEFFKNLDTIA